MTSPKRGKLGYRRRPDVPETEVFQKFRGGTHLKLNSDMCQLFLEVRHLGHIVSPEGVTTDLEKLEAVQRWPEPRDKHELRSLFGLCIHCTRFIAEFANIAKLLTQLTEENRTYQWSPEADAAFRALKEALCTAPVLEYPRPGETFVGTDASNVGIGCVLSQVLEGKEQVVAHISKILSKTTITSLGASYWPS
jgi:hypothetical protein